MSQRMARSSEGRKAKGEPSPEEHAILRRQGCIRPFGNLHEIAHFHLHDDDRQPEYAMTM
jgi:hypothetical protein